MDAVASLKLPEELYALNLKPVIEKGYLEVGNKRCSHTAS